MSSPDPVQQTSPLVDSLRSTAEILRRRQDEPFDHDSLAALLEDSADELMLLYREVLKDQLDIIQDLKILDDYRKRRTER